MDSKQDQPSNLNIANALTVLRIAGVPVFGWLLLSDGGDSATLRFFAWVVFALLMITDKIDGDLARKHGLVTDFGKLADPIADKALTGMAFVGLSIIGALWWWVTVVVLVREWGVTLVRLLIKKHGVMPARQGGKVKTMLQALALGGYVLPFALWDNTAGDVLQWVSHALMAAAVAMTLVSGAQFVRDAIEVRRHSQAAA